MLWHIRTEKTSGPKSVFHLSCLYMGHLQTPVCIPIFCHSELGALGEMERRRIYL